MPRAASWADAVARRPDFQSRPEHGKWQAVNHHRDCGSDNDFDDPGGWNRASYSAHPIDSMEPLSDEPNPYRAAALYHMRLRWVVDDFLAAAPDARLAVVAVAVVLGWPSVRGWTVPDIARQLGVSAATIARACAQFGEMSGLGAAGFQYDRPGAGFNGDKPAAVRA
jgi:hypothetical protein